MRYEETSIMDNLNCKMQAHARVCKENKLELELEENENNTYWNNFVVRDVSLKDLIGRVGGDISRWYSQGWFTIT